MATERRCWKCRRMADLAEMRYDLTGTGLTCGSCLAAERGRGEGKTISESETKAATAAENTADSSEKKTFTPANENNETGPLSYQCGSCGFGFTVERGAIARNCPHCGKGNFRMAFRNSAQQILEESKGREYES